MSKTLRVSLADINAATGGSGSKAAVRARYVDTDRRGRDIHLTDGTIVVPVRRAGSPGDPATHFDFTVIPSDSEEVREVDRGFWVEVSWVVSSPEGAKSSGQRHVVVTEDMDAVVHLGLLATPDPMAPYTGGYLTPEDLEELTSRLEALESAPEPVLDHGSLEGLDGDDHTLYALADGSRGEFATTAQGEAADSAVQPAQLDAAVESASEQASTELAAHAADTTAVHGIADTSALVVTSDPRLSDARPPVAHTTAAITDFAEAVQDILGESLTGSGVTVTYDDETGDVVITGVADTTDLEAVRDAIGTALVGLGLVNVSVDDDANLITITTSATQNSTDAALRDRTSHTGTQSLDTTTDSATRVAMTAAERTKLGGVATGATANATDAALRARSSHTGEQAMATVTGLVDALAGKQDAGGGGASLPTGGAKGASLVKSSSADGAVAWKQLPQFRGVWGAPSYGPVVTPVSGSNAQSENAVPAFTGGVVAGNGQPPKYILMDLGSAKLLSGWGISPLNSADGIKSAYIQTGDSTSGPWTTRSTLTGVPIGSETRGAFSVTARYVMIYVTETQAFSWCTFHGLKLYGDPQTEAVIANDTFVHDGKLWRALVDGVGTAPTAGASWAEVSPVKRSKELAWAGAVAVAAGTMRVYNDDGAARTIEKVRVSAATAPTGADLIVDVHKGGTTIFTTQANRPKVVAGANTGTAVPDVTAWADGEYLTLDFDQVGSTVPGSDVVVSVTYR